ncbi:MAG: hypothetical protein LBQ59_04875 [Candidatus Peribacteria bacterium]|nr:hypothetical protein [Candidatus Peribacteria bacterium]
MYIDGTAVSTKTISGVGAVSFGGFNRVVGKTPVRLDVKVSFTESFITDSTFSMALTKLDAFDTISSAQVENLPQVGAALFTMKDAKGTLSVSDNNPRPSLFLAGSSNNEIFAFRIKAENDNIGLDSLIFT